MSEDLYVIIEQFGFPVFVSVCLGWFILWVHKQHKIERDQWRQTMNTERKDWRKTMDQVNQTLIELRGVIERSIK